VNADNGSTEQVIILTGDWASFHVTNLNSAGTPYHLINFKVEAVGTALSLDAITLTVGDGGTSGGASSAGSTASAGGGSTGSTTAGAGVIPTDPWTVSTNAADDAAGQAAYRVDYEKYFTAAGAGTDQITHYLVVPKAYDTTGNTPIKLFVWGHGCGGNDEWDAVKISPEGIKNNQTGVNIWGDAQAKLMWAGNPSAQPPIAPTQKQTWISLGIGGFETQPSGPAICFNVAKGLTYALHAIEELEKHFNIDRSQIFLGGYSSGGDLTYYALGQSTASIFSGYIVMNSSPFGDSSNTYAHAASAHKAPVFHLAHSSDNTYPLCSQVPANGTGVYTTPYATPYEVGQLDQSYMGRASCCVTPELEDLRTAGYKVTLTTKPGGHGGVDTDLLNYLLPALNDTSWR